MKTAIYGAGSLGTVLGAYLTKGGVDVELVNRNKAHVEALRKNGAHITGTVDFTVPVRVNFPDEMTEGYDVIFLMTKQLANPEVVAGLKPRLSEEGVIVTLQNGIPEPGIAEIVGPDRTIGCTVEWGAALGEPGCSELTSDPSALSFHMGGMPEVPQSRLDMVKEVLEKMCPVSYESNLIGARWSKLLINSTYSGLGTVIGGTFGDVCTNPKAKEMAVRCMKECIDVGRASGAVFAPVQGKDITKLFYYKNGLKKAFAKLLVPIAMKKHYGIVPSMLQDLRKGKKCEIDAINGVVCEFGRKYGVPTPVNDRIVEIIKAEQEGSLPISAENIEKFYETMTVIIIIAVALLLVLWIVGVQRKLVSAEELCKNSMSQIGVQQNSRWDALTALAELVKGYNEHEYKTLMDVIGQRREVGSGSSAADAQAQEDAIGKAFSQIKLVAEQYPALKASEQFLKTMDSVNTYEDQVRKARMVYNDTVTKFNRIVRMFPDSLVASLLRFAAKDYLKEPAGKTEMPSMKI